MSNLNQYIGKQFNYLIIKKILHTRNNRGCIMCLCICKCTRKKEIVFRKVITGKTKSCGCLRIERLKSRNENLIGKRFGRIVITGKGGYNKFGRLLWSGICDCANKVECLAERLNLGVTRSCGCLAKERIQQMGWKHLKDLTNKKFGLLKVLQRVDTSSNGQPLYLCVCTCTNRIIVAAADLNRGQKSCGCHLRKGHETEIEKTMRLMLRKNSIKFRQEYRGKVSKSLIDFYVPNAHLAIYCDGDYWHRLPGIRQRDYRITVALRKEGYKVLRFWERDINNNLEKCMDKIKQHV